LLGGAKTSSSLRVAKKEKVRRDAEQNLNARKKIDDAPLEL
jgi:hypothetical protein